MLRFSDDNDGSNAKPKQNGANLPARDELDAALLDFVRSKANSFVKWDLMRLFYENPHTRDHPENIAKYAGWKVTVVEPELEELVERGLMEKRIVNGIPVYGLVTNEETKAWIEKFISACENRHFRKKAVDCIIPGTR